MCCDPHCFINILRWWVMCTFNSNVGRNLSLFLNFGCWVAIRSRFGRWAVNQAGASQSVRKTVCVGLGRSFDR